MAKQLDKTPIRMGYAIKVENTNRDAIEAPFYYAVKMENNAGDDEFWCLFTERELRTFTGAALEDGVKDRKPGRLYCHHAVGNTWRYFVLIGMPGKSTKSVEQVSDDMRLVTISDKMLETGIARAKKNQEDVPTMGWLQDMMD